MAYLYDSNEGDVPSKKDNVSESETPSGKKELDHFRGRLHEEILRSQRRSYPIALMRIAVEGAGTVDRAVVLGLADALKSSIREYDVLCTLRNDEFVIAFPETEERTAEQIAGRIRQTVEQKLWGDAVSEALGANIGIACFPQDGTNAEDLLSSAELDLCLARKMKR